MCRLTAPWVTESSAAAVEKLRSRTVASNARSAFSDSRGTLAGKTLGVILTPGFLA